MRRALLLGTVFVLSSSLPSLAASDYEVQQLREMIEQMRSELQQVKEENRKLREEIRSIKGRATSLKTAGAPSFKSKSGKSVDFYGYFKIDAAYSDSKAVGKDYILFALPESVYGSSDDDFNLNFKHSRFGFLIKTEESEYDILGNFEFDFYGDMSGSNDPNKIGVRVRKAWVQFGKEDWNIRAGLDWMLLTQLYPHLSNFPSGALMGNIGYRIPQVRFTKLFKGESGTLTTQIALDKVWGDPWKDTLKSYIDTGSDSGKPDVQGRIAYDTELGDIKFHVGAIGHYGQMEVDLTSGDKDLDTYSYGLEGSISPTGWLVISGKIWKGRNLGGWYTGGIGQGVLYVDTQGLYTKLSDVLDKKPTDAKEIDAQGGWIEITLKPNPKWIFHTGYGIDDPDNDDFKYNGTSYSKARTKNTMYYANGLYKLTPSLGFMMEYLRVETDYDFLNTDGTVNRFQGSILYFF